MNDETLARAYEESPESKKASPNNLAAIVRKASGTDNDFKSVTDDSVRPTNIVNGKIAYSGKK
jgi:hypothetical protein